MCIASRLSCLFKMGHFDKKQLCGTRLWTDCEGRAHSLVNVEYHRCKRIMRACVCFVIVGALDHLVLVLLLLLAQRSATLSTNDVDGSRTS